MKKQIAIVAAVSMSLSLMSMERDLSLEEKGTMALPFIIDAIANNHFPRKQRADTKHFKCFIQDIKSLSAVNKCYYTLLDNESMQQTVVATICQKMCHCDDKSDYRCAKQLAKFDQKYKKIVEGIDDAFDPNGDIRDVWYANATKFCEPCCLRSSSNDNGWGYDGGIITPLSLAIKKMDRNWCFWLIAKGAHVNKRYPHVSQGDWTVLCELIDIKNDVCSWTVRNEKEAQQKKKLEHICHRILLTLLINNARVDAAWIYNWCDIKGIRSKAHVLPLKLAICGRDEATVRLLCQYGATLVGLDLTDENLAWFNQLGICTIATAAGNVQ